MSRQGLLMGSMPSASLLMLAGLLLAACGADDTSREKADDAPQERARAIPNTFPDMAEVSVADVTRRVREEDRKVEIDLVRRVVFQGPLTVDYVIEDVEATAGEDYVAPSGTVTFDDGASVASVPIEVLDDFIYERGAESFIFRLTNVRGGELGTQAETIVTIEDNDEPPSPASFKLEFLDVVQIAKFPAQPSGTLLVTNEGGQGAAVDRVELTGEGFTLSGDSCSGAMLAPGEICRISWIYEPASLPGDYVAKGFIVVAGAGRAWTETLEHTILPEKPAQKKVPGDIAAPPQRDETAQAREAARTAWLNRVLRRSQTSDGSRDGFRQAPDPQGRQSGGQAANPLAAGPNPLATGQRLGDTVSDGRTRAVLAQEAVPGAAVFSYPIDRRRVIDVDKMIGCILVEAVSNELGEADITCRTDRPIYGGPAPDGSLSRTVLLPSGSTVLGSMLLPDSPFAKRIPFRMEKIIHGRTGATLTLPTPAEALDVTGRAGLAANSWENPLAPYQNAFLTTGIGLLANLATGEGLNATGLVGEQNIQTAQNTIAQTFADLAAQDLENRNQYRRILFLDGAQARIVIRPAEPLVFPEAVLGGKGQRLRLEQPSAATYQVLTLEEADRLRAHELEEQERRAREEDDGN